MIVVFLKNLERIEIEGDTVRISREDYGGPNCLEVRRGGYTRAQFFCDAISGWAIIGDEDDDEDEDEE